MSNYVTFTIISRILLAYKIKSYTQQKYILDLFCYGIQSGDFLESDFEITKTNKWINGKVVVPVEVCSLYAGAEGIERLTDTIEENITSNLLDFPMVMEKITSSVLLDDSIHEKRKKELLSGSMDSIKLAKIIQFAIMRDKEKKETGIAISVAAGFCGVEVPLLSNVFLGRNEELEELHAYLQKNKTVFVTGIAGIGKSELARQYARKYKKEYANIIYLTYENTLEYTIAHMYRKGEDYTLPESQLFDTHYRILQGLDENSLIIIDNYNTLPEESKLLRKFINHRFQTIFTTRMNIKGFPSWEAKEIQDMDTLLALFHHYYKYKPKEKETIQAIIEEVHAHTLTVELVSRTLQAGSIVPKDMLIQLIKNGLQTQAEEEVTIVKDEIDRTAVMYQHIKMLFNLYDLNNTLTESLMNLSLIPISGVEKVLFLNWRNQSNSNDINQLVRLGWVDEDERERKLYLHPMVQEVVKGELIPSTIKCRTLLESIHITCLHHGMDIEYYQTLFSMVMSITENIYVDDTDYWILFLEDAFSYMDKYGDYTNMKTILEKLETILRPPNNAKKEDVALMLDYKAQLYYLSNNIDQAVKRQKQALKIVPEIGDDNAHLHSNLHSNMGLYYMQKKKLSDAEKHIKRAIEILKDYNLMECHDIIPQLANYGSLLLAQNRPEDSLYYFEFSKKLITDYLGTDNSEYGIILRQIGTVYAALSNFTKALDYFSDAEKILLNVFPEEHSDIQIIRHYQSQIYHDMKKKMLRAEKKINKISKKQ